MYEVSLLASRVDLSLTCSYVVTILNEVKFHFACDCALMRAKSARNNTTQFLQSKIADIWKMLSMDEFAQMDEFGRPRPQAVAVELPPAVPEFGPALDGIVLLPVPPDPIITIKRRKTGRCRTKAKRRRIDAVTQSKRDANSRSNLLRLPAELRNYIHELVLFDVPQTEEDLLITGDEQCYYGTYGYHTPAIELRSTDNVRFKDLTQPPYTRVCHQLRAEALPMFYSNLVVCFTADVPSDEDIPVSFDNAEEFLAAIRPENRRLLHHVIFLGDLRRCSYCSKPSDEILNQVEFLVYERIDEANATIHTLNITEKGGLKTELDRCVRRFNLHRPCCGPQALVHVKFE
jgi:hypothetical protein